MSSVDVIIPTFDNVDELRRCIGSIASLSEIGTIFVCIDGSTDGTRNWLTSAPVTVTALEHPDRANHGRAATRNLALPHLTSEFVLLLDSDMRLAPTALATHLSLIRERRCVSVGRVVYDNADRNEWARYLMTRGANKQRSGAIVRPLDFATANSALRSEDLLAIGGFNESLRGYGGEDTELALALSGRGVPFVFNADAVATGTETKTVERGLAELETYGRTNLRTTRARHPDGPAPYWVDRLDSSRLSDRFLRALLNPVTDGLVDLGLRIPVFALQRRLLNYRVLRAVWTGYLQGGAS